MLNSYNLIPYTSAGGTFSVNVETLVDLVSLTPNASGITMVGNIVVNFTGTPSDGQRILITWQEDTILGANTVTINGVTVSALQFLKKGGLDFVYGETGGVGGWGHIYIVDMASLGAVDASILADATVTKSKLVNVSRGAILVGDASSRPAELDAKTNLAFLIGDGTDLKSYIFDTAASKVQSAITAGKIVLSFLAGAIVNADINAAAAIAWSKMAALTASKVVVTSAGGVITVANQLVNTLGGTGQDSSAWTGFVQLVAGTWSSAALTDGKRVDVSFETGRTGTYYLRVPFPCTITYAKARVTKAIAGTDDATITLQNNAGTDMTGGLITLPASSTFGTGVDCTPTTDNTFTAGQEVRFVVAKTTAGGECSIDITLTRLTLS